MMSPDVEKGEGRREGEGENRNRIYGDVTRWGLTNFDFRASERLNGKARGFHVFHYNTERLFPGSSRRFRDDDEETTVPGGVCV